MKTLLSHAPRIAARIVLPGVAAGALLTAPLAEAIPAFARKYETSCQTCHTVFPKLNAFGTAFRLNGYRMPKETEDMVKDKQISLGAPAYKKLWPQAIWPGAISSHVPLAVNIKFADVNTSSLNEDGTTSKVKNDFQFPQEVNLFAGGTLGDHVSYLGEVTFGVNADHSVSTEVEHAHIAFDSPFGAENLFHFKIGQFTPNVADVFQEMWITTDAGIDSVFNYNPIGLNGGTGLGADEQTPNSISFPALVQGIEVYGIVHHRLMYTRRRGQRDLRRRRPVREQLEGLLRAARLQDRGHGSRRRHGRQGGAGQELARRLPAPRRLRLPGQRRGDQLPVDRRSGQHDQRPGRPLHAHGLLRERLLARPQRLRGLRARQGHAAAVRRHLGRLPDRDRARPTTPGSSRPTTSSTPGCTARPATRPSRRATGASRAFAPASST